MRLLGAQTSRRIFYLGGNTGGMFSEFAGFESRPED